MTQYIIRRLLQSCLVILGVVTAVFIITNMTGDPVALMLGEASGAEDIERLREQLGLNEPLYVQYFNFLADAARGDFQDSLRFGGFSSMEIVLDRYPRTIALASVALFISAGSVSPRNICKISCNSCLILLPEASTSCTAMAPDSLIKARSRSSCCMRCRY